MSTQLSTPAAILRELHRLRRHAKNLQDEIDRQPRQLKAQQIKLARQEELQRQAQDNLKKLKVAISEKEKTLKSRHQEIAKHEKQRDEASAKKEYDALQHELTAARQACSQLEDEILAGLMETEEQTAKLPEFDKAVKQAKSELDNFDQISKDRVAGLKEELSRAQAQIKEVESSLPEDIRVTYTREVNSRGEDALALVQDKICQSCYTSITAQQSNELLQGLFVKCKSCGRILYLPE
jgi:predicted  nucleic acid-binding Zn-ribbon protein